MGMSERERELSLRCAAVPLVVHRSTVEESFWLGRKRFSKKNSRGLGMEDRPQRTDPIDAVQSRCVGENNIIIARLSDGASRR
jgi:hypothetical protein